MHTQHTHIHTYIHTNLRKHTLTLVHTPSRTHTHMHTRKTSASIQIHIYYRNNISNHTCINHRECNLDIVNIRITEQVERNTATYLCTHVLK